MAHIDAEKAADEAAETAGNMRQCLICGEPTRYAHFEIDACRACAVFYRRLTHRKNPLVCRTGQRNCETARNGNLSCKKCRYDRFNAVLSESKKSRSDRDCHDEKPSTSSAALHGANSTPASDRNLLAELRRGLLIMNAIRRTSELSTRPNIPDDYGIFVDGMMIYPTSYGLFNQNTRILISSIYEFARTAFDEFKDLSHEEQWLLVRNFYPFICVLDSEYRMTKLLPDKETMIFASYTTYLDHDTLFRFLSDTPNPKNSEEGMKFLTNHLDSDVRQMRANMKRWNPTEDEYFAFLGICFWSLDKISVSDRVHQIAEKYRQLLFVELENMYRNSMKLDQYASRLGEAGMIIETIQSSFFEMRSKIGMLKLLDVIGDEMLLAQLNV